MTLLAIGDRAPQFVLKDQDQNIVSINDFSGKWVVIYFYPKAMTPGCTVQACGLRDAQKELARRGIVVLGVSPDEPKLLKKFIEKEGLNFTLLSDSEHKMADGYGVWQEKSMYGRTYMGMARVTYVVDGTGIIRAVWPKVDPQTHMDKLLEWFDSQA